MQPRTSFGTLNVLAIFLGTALAAAPGWAMGSQPKEPEKALVYGTEAEPSIRDSDASLQKLLFQPEATAADPTPGSAPDPAPDKQN